VEVAVDGLDGGRREVPPELLLELRRRARVRPERLAPGHERAGEHGLRSRRRRPARRDDRRRGRAVLPLVHPLAELPDLLPERGQLPLDLGQASGLRRARRLRQGFGSQHRRVEGQRLRRGL
jgi:hypothetical protein